MKYATWLLGFVAGYTVARFFTPKEERGIRMPVMKAGVMNNMGYFFSEKQLEKMARETDEIPVTLGSGGPVIGTAGKFKVQEKGYMSADIIFNKKDKDK